MILVIDNFDSFTWNLVASIKLCGEEVKLVRNNIEPSHFFSENIKGVLLSPGPGRPENAGHLMEIINHYFDKVPILGICLGHQAIGLKYGANLVKASKPMHGKISQISCDINNPLFADLPSEFEVVRYHSLLLEDIPSHLKIIAQSQGQVMAICHNKLPVYGIQFHPEAFLTQYGNKILANWIKICQSQ